MQPLLLDKAKTLVQVEGKGGVGGQGRAGGSDKLPPAHPPATRGPALAKGCVLCDSKTHQYVQGNYGHLAEHPITMSCPLSLSDGAKCGLFHAFSGPLKTQCRGGLEVVRGK